MIRPQASNVTVVGRVATCQETTSQALLDHLVGRGEQFIWDGDVERLGHLEIYHKLKRRRLLDRQVAWVCPLENLVHIHSGAPIEPIEARNTKRTRQPAVAVFSVTEVSDDSMEI
jgi:hypothetical protein